MHWRLAPPQRVGAPPTGNPGSATDCACPGLFHIGNLYKTVPGLISTQTVSNTTPGHYIAVNKVYGSYSVL